MQLAELNQLVADGLASGEVRPLPITVFPRTDIQVPAAPSIDVVIVLCGAACWIRHQQAESIASISNMVVHSHLLLNASLPLQMLLHANFALPPSDKLLSPNHLHLTTSMVCRQAHRQGAD